MVIATMACSLACGVLFQLGIASLVKTDLLIFVRSFWFCFRFFACGCWSPSPECSSRSRHHFPTQHTHTRTTMHPQGRRTLWSLCFYNSATGLALISQPLLTAQWRNTEVSVAPGSQQPWWQCTPVRPATVVTIYTLGLQSKHSSMFPG